MNIVTADGDSLKQLDATVACAATSGGDLSVEIRANPEPSRVAVAVFQVHRNTSPQGAAQCEGIVGDPSSDTGYARSSCDVIVHFGQSIFAATKFERCNARVETSVTLRGSITCPLLRTGKQSLVVNKLSFYCLPGPETSATSINQLGLQDTL